MEFDLFKLLNAGGNLSMIALVFIMWKFDRRLVKIEVIIGQHLEKGD